MNLNQLRMKLLAEAQGSFLETEPRVLEDLLCYFLGLSWSDLHLSASHNIETDKLNEIEYGFEQLLAGVPLGYITGEKFFYKSNFFVDSRVLIPRPETEILVEEALKHLPEVGLYLDLGTGSGCIGLSIALERPKSFGFLLDISEQALEVCEKNRQSLNVHNVEIINSDAGAKYSGIKAPIEELDLVVANPPYIEFGDKRVAQSVHNHEPHLALYSAEQGLELIGQWQKFAFQLLSDGGAYIFEFGKNQETDIQPLLKAQGWR